MMILSVQRVYRVAGGYRILRPTDRSCWILVSPCGRFRDLFFTRREAVDWGRLKAANAAKRQQLA
jgi:hypothetical protein